MKKAVVTILLVLPFILMIIISFAAQIVSNYQYIKVESICVAKDERSCYGNEVLKIGLDSTFNLKVIVYPEFATNDKVTYASSNEEIITVTSEGVVKGIGYGKGTIRVESLENREIYSIISFEVRDDDVSSVELDKEELTLTLKQKYNLTTNVYPITALDKSVIYTSSHPDIASVDANGEITAKSAGEAIITVTSVDGNKSDTCRVIVENKIVFGFVGDENLYSVDTEQIDLNTLVIYDDSIVDLEDVIYEVKSGQYISLNGSNLTLKEGCIIRVEARVIGTEYIADIWLKYKTN